MVLGWVVNPVRAQPSPFAHGRIEMQWRTFFKHFGDMTIWQAGGVGKKGFTVEELYQAFMDRGYSEEIGEVDSEGNEKAKPNDH